MEKIDLANSILEKAGIAIPTSVQILKQGKLSRVLHNDEEPISQRRCTTSKGVCTYQEGTVIHEAESDTTERRNRKIHNSSWRLHL